MLMTEASWSEAEVSRALVYNFPLVTNHYNSTLNSIETGQ